MSRFCWWLVEIVSGVLEPDERDVARGDFAGPPPRHFGYALFYRRRDFSNNAAAFQLTFYRVIFPLIVQLGLVSVL
jgi:hypothetical protein